MISKLFSESAQGMFNIPELIQMEEAAKLQCQRVLHRSIMHFAKKLFLSEKTVKNHLNSIFKKIEVADRTNAALYAVRNGII